MKPRRYFHFAWALGTLLGGCACSERVEQDSPPERVDALPADLASMQGRWSTVSTNACCECDVKIDGYTVRLIYRRTANGATLRKNVSIHRVDERQNVLLLNNGLGIWPYALKHGSEGDRLELEFYSEADAEWTRVCMWRNSRMD